ncbi:MAG: hypothetical protein AAF264_04390 [Pseudomonadota bacterium]
MARKALRWAIYLTCVVPALLVANLVSDTILGAGPDLDGPTIQDVTPLLVWAAIMLTVWVVLGRILPDRA